MLLISDITTKTRHHVSPLMFNRLDQVEHMHSMRTLLIIPDEKRSKTTLNM